MEAAKSQFSYICLSCQVLLKERKRVLIDPCWKNYLKFLGAVMGNTTAFGAGEEGICHLVELVLFCSQRVIEFCLRGWTGPGPCPNDLHLNVFL